MRGLEALYKLEMSAVCDDNMSVDKAEELRHIIEKELKRLEYYDNLCHATNGILPKKQDWRLNQLLNCFMYIDQEDIRGLCQRRYEEIVDIIYENERNKKALEIIKEKASIDLLEELNDDEPYWLDIVCSTKLAKEEYDLLKEVLTWKE